MTPARTFMLLNTETRRRERRARIGTRYLAGPMPTAEQIKRELDMGGTTAYYCHRAIEAARRICSAGGSIPPAPAVLPERAPTPGIAQTLRRLADWWRR